MGMVAGLLASMLAAHGFGNGFALLGLSWGSTSLMLFLQAGSWPKYIFGMEVWGRCSALEVAVRVSGGQQGRC